MHLYLQIQFSSFCMLKGQFEPTHAMPSRWYSLKCSHEQRKLQSLAFSFFLSRSLTHSLSTLKSVSSMNAAGMPLERDAADDDGIGDEACIVVVVDDFCNIVTDNRRCYVFIIFIQNQNNGWKWAQDRSPFYAILWTEKWTMSRSECGS